MASRLAVQAAAGAKREGLFGGRARQFYLEVCLLHLSIHQQRHTSSHIGLYVHLDSTYSSSRWQPIGGMQLAVAICSSTAAIAQLQLVHKQGHVLRVAAVFHDLDVYSIAVSF